MSYEPNILALDVERCSMISRHYERYGNFSIQPKATIRNERIVSFAARWKGQPKSKTVYFSEWGDGRETMLSALRDMLDEATHMVGWNSKRFDTRTINRDLFLAGMDRPSEYVDVDLMLAVKRSMYFSSNSLKNVTRELGVEGKVEVHDLDQLTEDAMAGDTKAQRLHRIYNKRDVDVLLDELYPRLEQWLPVNMMPNMALGSNDDLCPRCGSDDLERRGFKYTATGAWQQYRCSNGHWIRGSRRIATSELRA